MNHPDKLNNFAVWIDGAKMLGIVDATLPNLTPMKETMKGAGIAGEIESRALGHFGSMKLGLTWRVATKEAFELASPEGKTIELRAVSQGIDGTNYQFDTTGIRVVVRASGSDMNTGKFDPATAMGTTTEVECLYYKYEYGGAVITEIDKLNFKALINGVDELAKSRTLMGE